MFAVVFKRNLDRATHPALSCGTSAAGPSLAVLGLTLQSHCSLPFQQKNKIKRLLPQCLQVLAAPHPS